MRNVIRYGYYALRSIFYLPLLVAYTLGGHRDIIKTDVCRLCQEESCDVSEDLALIYFLLTNPYFRATMLYRMGGMVSKLYQLMLNNHDFHLQHLESLGEGFRPVHAYATVINAKSIGKNFTIRQCTTIGNKTDGRNDLIPTIGDNVTLGCNVVIIGNIHIGNNVTIGAGSIVTHDIPDNSVVVGNPARIIKTIG